MVFVMKNINEIIFGSMFVFAIVVLFYFPISITLVSAAPPDPCFGNGAPGCIAICDNSRGDLQATCCWQASAGNYACQTCQINPQTGDYENCYYNKPGKLNNDIISPQPPSGNAPPTSTEKCPENVAVDKNGNCSPITQTPDEDNGAGSDKTNLRGNVLDDLMFSQSQGSSNSYKEQEGEDNQTNG